MERFDKEITLSAKISELDKLQEWLGAILDEVECSSKTCSQIAVVTEEIFTNICSHAYGGAAAAAAGAGGTAAAGAAAGGASGAVLVHAGMDGARLVLRFEDSGAAFNPLDYVLPGLAANAAGLGIGGLGLFFIKKWTDTITYARTSGDKNQLTVYKTIENRNV